MATASKQYIEAVGRRKRAIARVRITESARQSFSINDKNLDEYFATEALRKKVTDIFTKNLAPSKFSVSAKISGGGTSAQAEALRHGIARAIVKLDESTRVPIKKEGYLTRDPREKERRKFGLAKARKAKQWSKR